MEHGSMYESTFTLKCRPFAAAPRTEFYYPADSVEAARSALMATIRRGNGPAILIGEAGTGKTLLCTLIADHFKRADPVALLTCTGVQGRRALLQLILAELGLEYRRLSEGEMRLAIIDEANNVDYAHGLVLLVDEAHSLPTKLLEEIRMLSNVVQDGKHRVHVVLAGTNELEERFTSPRLDGFNQRIAARCYLDELDCDETSSYVRWQIDKAGAIPENVFTEDGLDATYQATGGVPRLINQLCDHALIMAAAGGLDKIDATVIQEAWADLQQLPIPSPKGVMATTSESSGIIEFGQLSDDEDIHGDSQPESELRTAYEADESLREISAHVQNLEDGAEEEEEAPMNTFRLTSEPGRQVSNPFDESFEEEEVVVSCAQIPDALLTPGLDFDVDTPSNADDGLDLFQPQFLGEPEAESHDTDEESVDVDSHETGSTDSFDEPLLAKDECDAYGEAEIRVGENSEESGPTTEHARSSLTEEAARGRVSAVDFNRCDEGEESEFQFDPEYLSSEVLSEVSAPSEITFTSEDLASSEVESEPHVSSQDYTASVLPDFSINESEPLAEHQSTCVQPADDKSTPTKLSDETERSVPVESRQRRTYSRLFSRLRRR